MVFRLFFLVVFLICCVHKSEADLKEILGALWQKAWKISCSYSTTTSRSKRSTIMPFPEDLDNSDEFFQYLYPSLDLKPLEIVTDSENGRSFTTLFTNTWMDDLKEYWESECLDHQASEKSFTKNASDDEDEEESNTETAAFANSTFPALPSNNSAVLMSMTGKRRKASPKKLHKAKNGNATEKQIQNLQNPNVPGIPPVLLNGYNSWFTSYGGDIEYFYPTFGFGIPFDGEITLLGFHGFKGLFPYRR